MMLSANACHENGLTFAAVHDSFWTHACDIDKMNSILRDAFVKMHSDDIIGRLAAEFRVRFGKNLFLGKVKVTGKIGKKIRERRQGLAKNSKIVELLDEHRRQTLLRSSDPAQQAEGQEMVTSASIFEKMGGTQEDLVMSGSLGETKVGHVPENLSVAERRPGAKAVDNSDPAIQSLFEDIELMDSESGSMAEAEDGGAPAKKISKKYSEIWLWLPMSFRDVPTKGSWDVSRIRQSEYFFS
jgi:DNA-directed RNA polymerase